MKLNRRHQSILDRLASDGECRYAALAGQLRVSAMTIRRDVDTMAAAGQLLKTLRGARRSDAGQSLFETDLQARLSANLPQKRAIAAVAAARIKPGQTLFLDGGTTCLELAKLLARQAQGVTLVSNSALICLHLGQGGAHNTIIALGGEYDAASASMHGPDTEAALARLYVDTAFLSTKGFLPEEGTFESAAHLYRLKQLVVGRARNVTLLVDAGKFGRRALAKVLDTAQLHTLITDAQAPAADLERLRQQGCEVLVAGDDAPVTADSGTTRPARQRGTRPAAIRK